LTLVCKQCIETWNVKKTKRYNQGHYTIMDLLIDKNVSEP